MQPTLLVLAAGIGSRYGGLKQVDGIGPGGEAILEFSVNDARQAGFGKVVFVIRKDIEDEFRTRLGHKIEQRMPVEYAFQEMDSALDWLPERPHREKPWGTGHAILVARDCIREPFAAINADDFYGADAFQTIAAFLKNDCAPDRYGMVAYRLGNTLSENGAVSRGVCSVGPDGLLTDVTERTKIERFPDGIHYVDESGARHPLADNTPVSMNFWGFHPDIFQELDAQFRAFVHDNLERPKAEFYIPTVVNNLLRAGKVQVQVDTCESPWYGVTYPADKATVQAALARIYPEGLKN
ncbi:MAG: nucleotidyltransferase [Saprospiraceae bacterium]|jgi:NDP-sugar pyrophosphorylase family protein|nr:nucleotidyltransferase [Saprospiraceae bacterium]